MIKVDVFRNNSGEIYGFTVKNHGSTYVCAAVSILVINTINSIEKFVGLPAVLEADEEEGYISCIYPQIKKGVGNDSVALLLNTMLFGLNDVYKEHKKEISINDKEVPL